MRCLSKEEQRQWPEQAIKQTSNSVGSIFFWGGGGGGQEWCKEGEGDSEGCLKWSGGGH